MDRKPENLEVIRPAHKEPEVSYTELFESIGITFDEPEVANPSIEIPTPEPIVNIETTPDEPSYSELFKSIGISFDDNKQDEEPAPLIELPSKEAQNSNRKILKYVAVTLGAIILSQSVLSIGPTIFDTDGNRPKVEAGAEPFVEETQETQPPVTEVEQPTTTEAPDPISFEVQPGDFVGTMHIPAICADIEIYSYSDQEKFDGVIGSGNAVLDRPAQTPSPNRDCTTLEERGGQPGDSLMPIAGYEQHSDGTYKSVLPGQPGNAVVSGHRTTFTKPMANIEHVQMGDEVIFDRGDGHIYLFKVVEKEIIPGDDFLQITDYSNPENETTLSFIGCSDFNGKKGSAAARYTVRAVLVGYGN